MLAKANYFSLAWHSRVSLRLGRGCCWDKVVVSLARKPISNRFATHDQVEATSLSNAGFTP